jgi:hypothetical protein
LVLFIGLTQVGQRQETDKNGPIVADPNPAISNVPSESNRYAALAETAENWAAMHPSDHLLKAHDDEARRRSRALDTARFLRIDDRRSKPDTTPKPL